MNAKEINCDNCGKIIYKTRTEFESYKNHFCSLFCRDRFHTNKRITKTCLFCKKKFVIPFNWESKFCCHKHSSMFRMVKREKIFCDFCGEKISLKKSQLHQTNFCNRYCRTEYQKTLIKDKAVNWLGGKSYEPYNIDFNKEKKAFIRKRDNYCCQECGCLEINLKKPLFIHHIDYNKKNNKNDNLVSLCNACHSKTNFRRKDWFLHFRRKINEKGR